MGRPLKSVILILCFLSFGSTVYATTPSISGVTGTIQTGQTITITGTTLLDENRANWVKGESHEKGLGASAVADGWYADGTMDGSNSYYSDQILFGSGSHSLRATMQRPSGESCPSTQYGQSIYQASGGVYTRMYFYVDSNFDALLDNIAYCKWNRFWRSESPNYLSDTEFNGSWPNALNNYLVDSTEQALTVYSAFSRIPLQRWVCLETYWDNANRRLYNYLDGISLGYVQATVTATPNAWMIGPINACPLAAGVTSQVWFTGFASSSSRIYPSATIEIGNGSNYSTATKIRQAPTSLTDTSIQISADLSGLGGGPYYLWVTNNRQERSAAYALSGGSGDTTPPVVSVTSPSSGTVLGTVSVNASCSDDTACTGVQFLVDGVNLGLEDTSSPWTISWDTTTASNGSHTLTAHARDAVGNGTTSSGVSVTVSNSAPASRTVYFQEGFDANTLPSRGWFDDEDGVDLDTDVKVSGTSSLRLTWSSSSTRPNLIEAIRHAITATDSLYISVYWRFNADWVGSGVSYHPHLINVLSDADGEWDGLAQSVLDTYLEVSYLTPRIETQDAKNVNTSLGALPNDLTATTEDRDVSGCNGCKSGSDCGNGSECTYYGTVIPYSNGRQWDYPSSITTNNWYKVEAYFKMNTITGSVANADGIQKLWINGVLVGNKTNIVYRTNKNPTLKWKTFVIAPWIGDGSPQNQTMWMDELEVSDSPPGILQSTSQGTISVGVIK